MEFQLSFLATWVILCITAYFTSGMARVALRVVLPVLFLMLLVSGGTKFGAVERLILTTGGLLYLIKAILLLGYKREELRKFSHVGLLLFMTVWPGMDPEPFRKRCATNESGQNFAKGFLFLMFGFVFGVTLSIALPYLPPLIVPWLGLISILAMLHFGYAEILTTLLRLGGWDVKPLFNDAYKATSLSDFWSKRWNIAFVEMDKILFLPLLRKVFNSKNAIVAVFLISGLLHELAVSYAAFAGWGGPVVYFVLQGIAFIVESKFLKLRTKPTFVGRLWTWFCVVAPLPLLFTAAFQSTFITPLIASAHDLIASKSLRDWFSLALYCAAIGNFATLGAGTQVPRRLNWKDEFAKLSEFNQKIFWTYYCYVGVMVATWGIVTFSLHDQLLNGERTALFFAVIIAFFWGARVLVDLFSFGHKGWPPGADMIVGHACLFSLFCALTATYGGLVIWHWAILF